MNTCDNIMTIKLEKKTNFVKINRKQNMTIGFIMHNKTQC